MVKKDEIDLMDYIRPLWLERRKLLYIVLIFLFFGILIAILQEREYTADTVFIPQIEGESGGIGGKIGGLASLAGIDIAGSAGGIIDFPPSLYPNLLDNIDTQLKLLESKIYLPETGDSVSYKVFYDSIYSPSPLSKLKKYTFGLPGVILNMMRAASNETSLKSKQEKYYRISESEYNHLVRLKSQMTLSPDPDAGYVALKFIMNDPEHAAQMAGHLEKIIHKELVDYRVDKIDRDLIYLEDIYKKRKEEFIKAQEALAEYMDGNQKLSQAMSQNQLQRLENDYDLAFDIYKDIAASLEQKRMERSKNTPLIKTIKPIVVPFIKSAPNRPLTALFFAILGLILGVAQILVWPWLKLINLNIE